jgi:hypothetical protein
MTDFMTGQYREVLGLGAKAGLGNGTYNSKITNQGSERGRPLHTKNFLIPMFQVVPGFSQGAEFRSAADEDGQVAFERVGIGLGCAYEIYLVKQGC